jgi:hypothetical protein
MDRVVQREGSEAVVGSSLVRDSKSRRVQGLDIEVGGRAPELALPEDAVELLGKVDSLRNSGARNEIRKRNGSATPRWQVLQVIRNHGAERSGIESRRALAPAIIGIMMRAVRFVGFESDAKLRSSSDASGGPA